MITMGYSSSPLFISLAVRLFLLSCSRFEKSFANISSTAFGGTTWINNFQSPHFLYAGAFVRPILLTSNISYNNMNLKFGCGFFCYGSPCRTGYLFSTFFVIYGHNNELSDLQIVWSSNREQMVHENATLTLTSTGELVLRDADSTLVWSTHKSSQDFQMAAIRESGNLVLISTSNRIIWQSFDHPTDTLLLGQKLGVGQKLTADASPDNKAEGKFWCSMFADGVYLLIATVPPQIYYKYPYKAPNVQLSYVMFDNVSLYLYDIRGSPTILSVPRSCLYVRIDSDGHLQFYSFLEATGRSVVDFLSDFTPALASCEYPTPCGNYSVCKDGDCSCPKVGNAFHPIDDTKQKLGCLPRRPLVCSDTSNISRSSTHGHYFLELEHVSYFTYSEYNSSIPQLVSRDYCQNLCLANCSCKAAFFRYGANFSRGYCYLESNVYSLKMNNQNDAFYNSTAYIKVKSRPKQTKHLVLVIIVASIGGLLLFLLFCSCISKYRKAREERDEDEDDRLDWPAEMPLRFSFQELQNATNDFSMKLGTGGFGSVYKGVLSDGSNIAVKRLDKAGQGKKEFRAEVETIGNIDHLNLVRLKGFCAEKAHRLLVYEYLPNGSLDKWVFTNKMHQQLLDWKTRYKVVLNIARGLTYLHEECRKQIIHFDIKPQNILLDQNFNAKVSDFGLAKLVNRDQSEVITTLLRGTPGYMAPELLNMHFTEKADIFSFGVMAVEIVSGKRSRDLSENGLFSLLQLKAEEGRLVDLLYEGPENEETSVRDEAVKLLKVGMWCIQDDFTRRPAMSIVVKSLEGFIDTLDDVPCAITGLTASSKQQLLSSTNPDYNRELSYTPTASVLSLPR